jgi:esterase/lipase superfamily enzyme
MRSVEFNPARAMGFVLSVALLMVGGCSSSETLLMPTPHIYAQPDVKPFADVPPNLQSNQVEVLYLTDREPENSPTEPPRYGFKRSRSVAFGVSHLEIGKGLSWDEVVQASTTSKRKAPLPIRVVSTDEILRYPETPRILMTLPPNQPGTAPSSPEADAMRAELEKASKLASEELSARLELTPQKEVYLFVHGYNNNFNDAILTIGQIWHFLGRRGVPIAYTWPAGRGGLLRGYTYDRESSEFTVFHLKEVIREIAACPEVKKIHIISHSRGTGVILSALCELHLEISGSGRTTRDVLKLGNVIMAAPDIDLDVMIQRAVTVRLGLVPERTTIYVCANDEALSISNWLFGGLTRFGAATSKMFPPNELKTLRVSKTVAIIDARVSDAGAFSHNYFYANPAVSSDLILLLRYGRPPGAENGRPLKVDEGAFWIVDDNYPGPTPLPTAAQSP